MHLRRAFAYGTWVDVMKVQLAQTAFETAEGNVE